MKVLLPNFKKRDGLITIVAQDALTMEILMVAYTDRNGYLETLKTGKAVYWSTSRQERWMKGEQSGDTQEVVDILIDCDGDALIYLINQKGDGACHTKAKTCFYRYAISGVLAVAEPPPKAGPDEELDFVETEVCQQLVETNSPES